MRTSRRATTYGDRPPSRAWLDHKRGVMKRPPRPPRFPAAADRSGAPARCITTRPPRAGGIGRHGRRATPEVVGPPGVREPARRTPACHCRSGVAGVGATIRGHLPEIAARRVRSGLPAPPPSPPDARTPGSRGANSAFFFEFQVIAVDLGRVPKKTRRGRGKAAASVQRIVSRTGFRGPGLGASADSGGRRFGLRNPERSTGSRCAYASRHPRYPGVIPGYPGYKTFDRAQGGDSIGCNRT